MLSPFGQQRDGLKFAFGRPGYPTTTTPPPPNPSPPLPMNHSRFILLSFNLDISPDEPEAASTVASETAAILLKYGAKLKGDELLYACAHQVTCSASFAWINRSLLCSGSFVSQIGAIECSVGVLGASWRAVAHSTSLEGVVVLRFTVLVAWLHSSIVISQIRAILIM
jgi:hypothetical protein